MRTEAPPAAVDGNCDCRCAYERNSCDKFKLSLPAEDQHKVIDCKTPASSLEKVLLSAEACNAAPWTFATDLIKSPYTFVISVREGFESAASCFHDRRQKIRMLRPVYHGMNPGVVEIMVKQWTCAQIRQWVQSRVAAYERSIASKTNQFSLNPGELTPAELKYLERKKIEISAFEKLAQKYKNQFNCFKAEEQFREYCRMAVDIAATVAGGLATRANFPRTSAIAEAPKPPPPSSSAAVAAPVKVPAQSALSAGETATSWAKFNRAEDSAFKTELQNFRGNSSVAYNQSLRGGEGQLFLSDKHPNLTLKRFFQHSSARNPWKGVETLENTAKTVATNAAINPHLAIARVHKRGPDWIVRDFDPSSVPLKQVSTDPAAREARRAVLNAIKDSKDPGLSIIRQYLEANPPSPNVHWSPTQRKVFIMDLSRANTPAAHENFYYLVS